MSSSLQGFVVKRIWIHGDHKSKNESLGKSFYSLSFNFQKVSNFTQSITQQSNKQSLYLFIITFQNLEFWDVTSSYSIPPIVLYPWLTLMYCVRVEKVWEYQSMKQLLGWHRDRHKGYLVLRKGSIRDYMIL